MDPSYRCDGSPDCDEGEDEMNCKSSNFKFQVYFVTHFTKKSLHHLQN